MKHQILTLLLTVVAATGTMLADNGIGAFSVSAKQKVTFSPGNLQFNAAQGTHQCADGSTLQGTWRFAPNQWDIVGMGYGQTNTSDSYRCDIGGTVEDGDNRKISSTYDGWIDLFGWGTSGWNSGAVAYQPWSTSQNNADYYPGGSSDNTLTGDYAYADWGVYNQIGDDAPGTWRTLTYDEWAYLIYKRPNAASKYGAAKVNGITGLVILPDKWALPSGCGFTAGMTSANSGYDWSYVATTNIYTLEQWQLMEDAGAVFLPCVGFRGGKSVSYVGTLGNSWSSSAYSISNSHYLDFKSNTMSAQGSNGRFRGRSVRLVAELPEICGTIETTDGTTVWEDDLPYAWEDKTFTEAGTQTTTLKNMDGCDSIVTFTLRVRYHNIVLQENESGEYYDFFAEDYNSYTLTSATLNRQFTQGKWATLCLPFNVTRGQMMVLGLYGSVYEFRYATMTGTDELEIYFVRATRIEAGKGYVVNANAKLAARSSLTFVNITVNTDADTDDITTLTGYNDGSGRGSIYMVGSLRTGLLLGTITDNIYLGLKDNKIYYPNLNTGTPIRAYRSFFRSEVPLNAQRIRIIADGEDKGELIIDNGQLINDNSSAVKYISNGILYIERNGIRYTAQGQRLD